jgi:hypothetical protein
MDARIKSGHDESVSRAPSLGQGPSLLLTFQNKIETWQAVRLTLSHPNAYIHAWTGALALYVGSRSIEHLLWIEALFNVPA